MGERSKVVIVGGAGGVGSSVAFNLLRDGGGEEIVLVDSRPEMVTSHLMDLEQVIEQGSSGSVRAGELDEVGDADVLVMASGAPLNVNDSRMVYLEDNSRILEPALDLLGPAWGGVVLMVTNPVDPLVTWAQLRSGLDRRRIVGYTLNDSLRMRTGIAKAIGAEIGSVEAWVIGEHGDASVPLFDRVKVAGAPVELTRAQIAEAEDFLRSWYARHVALDSGRSSTWTSGRGVARMVQAVSAPGESMWAASVLLDGEYGMRGIALGVPVSLGPGGVTQIHEWELTPDQCSAFHAAAVVVRNAAEAIIGSPSL